MKDFAAVRKQFFLIVTDFITKNQIMRFIFIRVSVKPQISGDRFCSANAERGNNLQYKFQ